ncbi:MAG: hypothetical protein DSM106950_34020 [Stigonema ocellatum SAG 48.90 = DSM 106950]|nr:hypothetical protein [Stigonema ocellatum SAG 48.90 = DSM 106950]
MGSFAIAPTESVAGFHRVCFLKMRSPQHTKLSPTHLESMPLILERDRNFLTQQLRSPF